MKNTIKKFEELSGEQKRVYKFVVEYVYEGSDEDLAVKRLKNDIENVGWTDNEYTLNAEYVSSRKYLKKDKRKR
jgi:hypothetical protein